MTRAATGEAALAAQDYDVVLLDLGLPDLDGFEVCRRIRARSEVPIIVVTARGDEVDRVVGLELGADDYMVKPFGFRELLARIRAVTRRTLARPEDLAPRTVGALDDRSPDPPGHDGRRGRCALTPKEFDLLALLAEEPGAVFTRVAHPRRGLGRALVRADQDARRPRRRRCARSSATRRGSRRCGASGSGCVEPPS